MSSMNLASLPTAIFVPAGPGKYFHIYRGSPATMVEKMAEEMGSKSIESTVQDILLAIALHRRIMIRLPEGLDDEKLAAAFVFALLDTKIARPVPLA